MAFERQSRPNSTRRKRLKGYDYRIPGYYFLTICQRDRLPLFTASRSDNLNLNPAGTKIAQTIQELESRFPDIQIDSSVVMPNHVHILIGLSVTVDAAERDSIIDAVHWWKTVTTTRYIHGVKNLDWPRFKQSLWQEGYHDRIVRNERELNIIRNYIRENPMRWREDEFYEDQID